LIVFNANGGLILFYGLTQTLSQNQQLRVLTPLVVMLTVNLCEDCGIKQMRFTIWNRWGQKVFETNSTKIGWDVDAIKAHFSQWEVYAYTLEVNFTDGTKASVET